MLVSFDPVAAFSAKKKKNMGVVTLTKLLRTRRDLTSVLPYFLYSYATEVWSAAVDARYHSAKTLHADSFKSFHREGRTIVWTDSLFLTTNKAESLSLVHLLHDKRPSGSQSIMFLLGPELFTE